MNEPVVNPLEVVELIDQTQREPIVIRSQLCKRRTPSPSAELVSKEACGLEVLSSRRVWWGLCGVVFVGSCAFFRTQKSALCLKNMRDFSVRKSFEAGRKVRLLAMGRVLVCES